MYRCRCPWDSLSAFLGPSGCGKTTLLRMIAGLETPSAGRILMSGLELTRTPAHQRNFAMVFQQLALFPLPHRRGEHHLQSATAQRRAPRAPDPAARAARTDQTARHRGAQSRSALGGQRQRVAIARALAQEPMLFLLDETALGAGCEAARPHADRIAAAAAAAADHDRTGDTRSSARR